MVLTMMPVPSEPHPDNRSTQLEALPFSVTLNDNLNESAKVSCINDGEVLLDGTPREVFSKTELLHSVGLEAPQGCELVDRLRAVGVDIKGTPITESECVGVLVDFLKSRK